MLASLFVFMFVGSGFGAFGVQVPAPGPIIIQTVRQPPITPEISMGDVVLGAIGLVGTVMIAALVAGLLIGIGVVMIKRSRDATAGPTDPGHAKLRT